MHFEILVEDLSGRRALDFLLPRIVAPKSDTFYIHSYKGIGRIPGNMKDAKDPSKRILLENLPKLLKGYGQAFAGYGAGYRATVVLICDLDDRDASRFLADLQAILDACQPKPQARFCLAIEEGEAWLLGDLKAVRAAYPAARDEVLSSYKNDSICGTWEKLADAVYPGGSRSLAKKGWQAIGAEKYKWAETIAPKMDVETNASPSFRAFRDALRELGDQASVPRQE
ncbi:MAG TPA: hypothetical protein DEH78_10940 [Solibacterales bacterium]|nr:hypothetical protein [Bryobacterales bacterium]